MSSSHPFITVITPTYNAGMLIGKCMESVARQTYRHVEHIIMDGGSTDDTLRQVQNFKLKNANLRLITEKDGGVYDAMNKAIAIARNGWLYFLGSDDTLFDEKVLEKMAIHLADDKNRIVYGNVYFENLRRIYDYAFGIEKLLKRNICHQAVFYHSSVFDEMGLYDLKYPTQADYDFNLKCWISGSIKPKYVPEIVANYAEGGLSSKGQDAQFVQDFPEKTVALVFAGQWTIFQKIDLTAKIIRKIIQRKQYGIGLAIKLIFQREFLFLRLCSFLWMFITLPFYLIKRLI